MTETESQSPWVETDTGSYRIDVTRGVVAAFEGGGYRTIPIDQCNADLLAQIRRLTKEMEDG